MIQYIIETSICWALFFAIYWAFLRKETFFFINRGLLLGSLLLGLVLPAIHIITLDREAAITGALDGYLYTVTLQKEAVVTAVQDSMSLDYISVLFFVLLAIYLVGFVFFLMRFAYGLLRIYSLYANADIYKKQHYSLVNTEDIHLPFSFFHWVFISKKLKITKDLDKILQHELFHVRRWHSIDIICLEILHIVFWFNPILILYKREIKQTHEYLADAAVIKDSSVKNYGELLLRQSTSGLEIALANHFFQSHLKNRISMMYKQKSRSPVLLKYLLVLPVLAIAIIAFSSSFSRNAGHETNLDPDIQLEFFRNKVDRILSFKEKPEEKGTNRMMQLFEAYRNEVDLAPCYEDAQMVLETLCEKHNLTLHFDHGEIKSICSGNVKDFVTPPGQKKGNKNTSVSDLSLQSDTIPPAPPSAPSPPPGPPPPPPTAKASTDFYTVVEERPRFTGCENQGLSDEALHDCATEEMLAYIYSNLKYPTLAKENGVQGQVVVQFIIDKNGKIKHPQLLRDIGANCGEAALELVKSMNNLKEPWIPGRIDGKAVNVQFTLPIKFKLAGDKKVVESKPSKKLDDSDIFTIVDTKPRFKGCEDEKLDKTTLEECAQEKMLKFLYSNIKYPDEAKKAGVEGQTVLQFVIEKDGSVSNTTVVRRIGGGCDEEAKRVIESMSKMWHSGQQAGEKVRVQYTLPIRFKLADECCDENDTAETVNKRSSNLSLEKTVLKQNAPNPFNDKTTVSFTLPEFGNAKITFLDNAGRVLKIYENHFPAGVNEIDIRDNDFNDYFGIIYYHLETKGGKTKTLKMVRTGDVSK